jgi:hypothetical protein
MRKPVTAIAASPAPTPESRQSAVSADGANGLDAVNGTDVEG